MKFPNLAWAIKEARLTHYKIAAALGMGETRFSRSMNGLQDFTSEERKKISQVLGYDAGWLFQGITPPRPAPKDAEPVPIYP